MTKGIKAAIAATVLVGATLGATAPAQANGAGWAVGAGLLGLGVGAAIASDHPHYAGYYAPLPPPPGYYAPPPPPPGYYAPPPPPPGYYEGCRSGYRWSHYWHQYVPDRRCY